MTTNTLTEPPVPQLTVSMPSRVGGETFELTLKAHYSKSLKPGIRVVEFDFGKVTWCGIFELSLISLWILDLLELKKQVSFRYPADKSAYKFLAHYRFDSFLTSHNVRKEGAPSSAGRGLPTNMTYAPFYPLTFFSDKDFGAIVEDLGYGNRLEVVLADVKDAEVVKSGAIRDVVLKELVDNLVIHAGRRFANLVMTKHGAKTQQEAGDWTKSIEGNVTELERPFFKRLYGRPFISLVISDKGAGIVNTLRDAYMKDAVIPGPKHSPRDEAILEYAFMYHTTRRSLEERIGEIEKVISEEARNSPPPTGLYRLKEVVRDYYGLLYVRSGSSVVCYDFYNNRYSESAATSYATEKHGPLTNFGGTQYKIYFPVHPPIKEHVARPPSISTATNELSIEYRYISVADFFTSDHLLLAREAEQLHSFFTELDKISFRDKTLPLSIVVDFSGDIRISAKAFHYLLFEVMQRQTATVSFVVINLSGEKEKLGAVVYDPSKTPLGRLKPLLSIDYGFYARFLGVPAGELSMLNSMLDLDADQTEEMRAYAERHLHLFVYDINLGKYRFIHDLSKIIQLAKDEIRKKLEADLLSPATGIFHKDRTVLLPSRRYCRGYFEVNRLITFPSSRDALRSWYRYSLAQLTPDFVISVSDHVGSVVGSVIEELGERLAGKPIHHINISTPPQDVEVLQLLLRLEPGWKGVIITEVIGTAETLKAVFKQAQHTEIVKILTTVNAHEEGRERLEFKNKAYEVDAVLNYPNEYHRRLPQGWKYSELDRVDPETHLLISDTTKLEGPLWKDNRCEPRKRGDEEYDVNVNTFLEECVIPTNSFVEDHFTNSESCMTFLFNIPSIVKHFASDITKIITDDVKKYLANITPVKRIARVIYISTNPGLDVLANVIAKQFDKCEPLPLNREELKSRLTNNISLSDDDAVILIDDAFVTGDSMFRVYDIVEGLGASHMFSYALIKRGGDFTARKMEKISEYGHLKIQFRYLTDTEIPTFSSQRCPVCERLYELEQLKEEVGQERPYELEKLKVELGQDGKGDLFSNFLDEEISKLSQLPVDVLEGVETYVSDTPSAERGGRLTLRWKLELAKKARHHGVRKELTMVVGDFETDPRTALSLCQLIFQEKGIFLHDETVKETLFYSTFTEKVIAACKHFISNPRAISAEDLEAVFYLLSFFDSDYLSANLYTILKSVADEERKLLKCLVQMFFMTDADEYPGRLANVLGDLHASIEGEDLKEVVLMLRAFWRKTEEQLKELISKKLSMYRQLTGGIFHEIGHLRDNLLHNIVSDPLDPAAVVKAWASFYDQLLQALPLLRGCIGNRVNAILYRQLNKLIDSLNFQMSEGNKLIDSIELGLLEKVKPDLEEIRQELEQITQRIYALIYEEGGVKDVLEGFKTNAKSVVHSVLQQQKEDLHRHDLVVKRELPEEACTVFGEDVFLVQVFQNLMENVWKHAEASSLRILMLIDRDAEEVDIQFIDNGSGITQPIKYGQGLKIVRGIVLDYGGTFQINVIEPGDEDYALGYKTRAGVRLPLIRSSSYE